MEEMLKTLLLERSVREFYQRYHAQLDQQMLTQWPDFFTEDASYLVTNRANFEEGMLVYNVFCEGKKMLIDRALGLQKAVWFRDRLQRRFAGSIEITHQSEHALEVVSSFMVTESRQGEPSTLLLTSESQDSLSIAPDGTLQFSKRLCIIDAEVLPDSIIYPI
ncbi:hypothetical protein L1285_01805 [Pseudoalteromonas sp. DL2-H2.2]|uniref:Aromatic-ring-hydroxylating dioxygenase subunit beta n=1 Tax=Pseudoalteromonas rubra TaxID=43658 RepID=A0A0F4QG10_9GAMM|nr:MULTISPECIES: aromatic-ring-hydroxylating dioxygenase subunit beta [Pseudoalteromonas]KJZ05632.1 hypothetical protein TW77_22220 [Pseudoalteromonas rubra]MCF2907078.1 hypothetical protein [Pseudoalteromonas sp. DL2-H2.2]